jgi:hypothetical protein
LAAAAVDRLAMCGDAVWDLQQGSAGGLSGLIVRHAFECWLLGLYVCLDGPLAVRHLLEADAQSLRALVARWPSSTWGDELEDHAGRPSRRLNLETVADHVRAALEKRGTRNLNPSAHYRSLYRVESRTTAHAGLSTLVAHTEPRDDQLGLASGRPTGHADEVAYVWIVTYAAHLGGYVFDAFGLDRSPMDHVLAAGLALFD